MVYVKKVEIFGFKSFGFKNTTVTFKQGLISISGPNGSGKSNILDAIIFAMGENKPKIMRVDKLKSLIHDIEGNRHSAKMARSSVHFDNSDRKIPVNSDLVEITRELDANGENTYYLNKKKTNRSNILNLLDMANAGLGQLNAVQQGTVTRISEFTSEEKRKILEDLVGLSYFDEKKTESLKQLEDADRRLEIALAKMGEIKKRIDELEEERNQKLRHDLLTREINRYKAISAANQLKLVSEEKTLKESTAHTLASNVTALDGSRILLRSEIAALEAQKAELMSSADAYNTAKSSLDTQISQAMQQYETSNNSISTSKKRLAQIDIRVPEIAGEIEELTRTQNNIRTDISSLEESLGQTGTYKDKIRVDLERIDSQRDRILEEQSRDAAIKSEVDNKIKSLTAQLNEATLKLAKIQHQKEEMDRKFSANSAKLDELKKAVLALTAHKTRMEGMMKNHADSISEIKSRIEKLHAAKSKISCDNEELELILEKSGKAATQYESKIQTVKGFMHEDYTIAKLKENAHLLGIRGLVYEIISWNKKYERCVLAVSSDWIKAIVVDDFATLLGIAEVAKNRHLAKLRIIPLDAIPQFELTLPEEPGVLGVLADYVDCAPLYCALKTFLFGSVVLTQDRESAFRMSKLGYKSVTIAGEYFEANGGTVVIDINSKISKLTKLISMSSDIDGLLRSIALIKRYVLKKKNSMKKLEGSIASHNKRLYLSENSLTLASENHSNLASKIDSIKNTGERLAKRISELSAKDIAIASEITSQRSRIDSIQEQIKSVELPHAPYGGEDKTAKRLAEANRLKSEFESLHTSVMNQYTDQASQLTTLQMQHHGRDSESSRLTTEENSLTVERQDLEEKIQELEILRESKSTALVSLRQKEQELISGSGSSISDIQEFDESLKTLSEKDREMTKQINSIERQSDLLGRDLRDLTEKESRLKQVLTAFGFHKGTETFDVESIISGLSSELSSLSALNAKAPQTYLEVSYGYRSMSARKNSLEEERSGIVRFIEDIDKDKKQTFLDAFDIVDKEIRLIFNKMTGGNAWLELQDEDDIFGSGISYLLQFPNKQKRESTSISGGEKTLAAIVFVLALQKLKPSPFYLFDEIDAHLDAPNSQRLAKILEERSKESQFIMVSLKDSVIQKAELIYGVFPKNGVSNIVTYKDKRVPSVTASSTRTTTL